MKTLYLFPPNFNEINKAFNVRGKPVIFAYGDAIYNPRRITIPPQLIAHEQVHLDRQHGNPAAWWRRYIDDPQFRLDEEIPAYAAEYRDFCGRICDPGARSKALGSIAERLASPLYGSLIDVTRAERLIRNGQGASW